MYSILNLDLVHILKTSNFEKAKKCYSRGARQKVWVKIERSCGEANLTLHKNFPYSPDCQMAENLNPPRIAGPHFFLDLKTMHFGRNGSSNSTTEAAASKPGCILHGMSCCFKTGMHAAWHELLLQNRDACCMA